MQGRRRAQNWDKGQKDVARKPSDFIPERPLNGEEDVEPSSNGS